MPYKNSEQFKKKVFEETLQKIEKRGHFYVEGQYENKHLNSANSHPHLVSVVENGVVLTKELHLLFHKKYGYTKNTLFQFQSFLRSLLETQESKSTPISSQANSEELDGSETRAYDPDRIKKLHECLGKISLSHAFLT